ncbi:MAG: hypothetical protein B6I35_03880 [Anaerolineaceae bacterium 4572_32.2]|nr:MAG: hypothetical protein B6I35_03880 [Anaerolineaceae bacterium 4572_32.2]
MSSVDEARLIQQAKEGDSAAFAEVYDRYQPIIYRYISYRAGATGIADDLTGGVFVRLVESIDRFSHQDDLLARLCGIAEDLIADRQRRAGKPLPHPSAGELPPEQRLTLQSLTDAVARLTEVQRQVILLKFVEGLDDETLSRTLGQPIDAVWSLQQQALAAFAIAVAWSDAVQTSSSTQRHQEELERLLGDGIQNLTHELRTPLNLIHGYAELLLGSALGPIQPEQHEALQVICDGAEALACLVRNLTTLRNIPKEALVLDSFSVTEWVNSTADRFRRIAEQVGIQLEIYLPDDLPPILGDQEHLSVALSQMLDNAIKYSPDGGQISVQIWMGDGGWLYVVVQDEGIGIAPEHLDRIFDRFYQIDSSATRRFGGAGIGLGVVRAIAEAHGGQVRAASEGVGMGSTFMLMLPVWQAESPALSRQSFFKSLSLPGQSLGRVLDEHLLPLEEGRVTLEECLTCYPEYAVDLRPLLEIALKVRHAPRLTSSHAVFAAGKRWMLEALAEKKRSQVVAPNPFARLAGRASALFGKWEWPLLPRPAIGFRPALTGVLALLVLVMSGLFLWSRVGVTVPRAAALIQTSGTVEILSTGSDTWRRVSLDERVETGDRIRTGALSAATLSFFDGSVTDLEAETEVTVAQLRSQRDGNGKVIVLHQWVGQTRNSVEPLTDMASRFQVETPSAVMAVRGTEFEVVVEASGTTRVAVAEGAVDVTSQKTTVAVLAGEETMVLHEQPLLAAPVALTITPIPMPTLLPSSASDIHTWTPTPEPSETPRPIEPVDPPRPVATSTPSGGGGSKPTEIPEPTEAPMPTEAPKPTEVPTPRPTLTRVRPTPTPPPTNTPTPIPTDTPTPVPTDTPTLVPTDTPMPGPTDTPAPPTDTPTPRPTLGDTPTPGPTDTPIPPTDTPIPPTDTPLPDTSAGEATPTPEFSPTPTP